MNPTEEAAARPRRIGVLVAIAAAALAVDAVTKVVVVALLAATTDLRGAIGFSSFAVLIYYAIANASAFTLGPDEGRPHRAIPVIGVLGCVVLAFAMPLSSVLSGVVVLGIGVAAYLIRRFIAPIRLRRNGNRF